MGATAIPYVAALDGALRAAGMWDEDVETLAGLTGLTFHLVVDPKTCPSSPTAYPWTEVHSSGAERAGVTSTCLECVGETDAYPARRDAAVRMVKDGIDRGVPSVIRTVDWAEFAIVTGYDDADGVLFVEQLGGEGDPILYANLGSPHGFPCLFAQTFETRSPADREAAVHEALRYAITCWTGDGFAGDPSYRYAVGADGYDALIAALEGGDTDPLGLRYILKIHADARRCAAAFTRRFACGDVADAYDEVAPLCARAAELLPARPPFERPLERDEAREAATLLREARSHEERAVAAIGALV